MVPVEGLLGYVLLLVGFVFFGNGMTLLGKTGAKEIGVLNLGVGILIAIAAYQLHTLGLTAAFALVSVFALIYFMVAGIFINGYDGKGLGWYCLFRNHCIRFMLTIFLWVSRNVVCHFRLAWALLVFPCIFCPRLGKGFGIFSSMVIYYQSILTLLIPDATSDREMESIWWSTWLKFK
jgi:hypothetical protein